jgi:hypothetical protein
MGLKLTTENLNKIIVQEIKKIAKKVNLKEAFGMPEEEEDMCPEGMVWNEELGDCVDAGEEGLDPVHQDRPDAGKGWEAEEIADLAQELEKMGFVRR